VAFSKAFLISAPDAATIDGFIKFRSQGCRLSAQPFPISVVASGLKEGKDYKDAFAIRPSRLRFV